MSSNRVGIQGALVRFAIRFRGATIALGILLLAYGVYDLGRARYDVFPEFAPPQTVIQTEAPGLAPEQVEILITQPIENEINGVPGVAAMRSSSVQGLSVITVVFDPNGDIYRDRQAVSERLATISASLPQGVGAPAMTPLTSSTSTVLIAGLTSEVRSLMDLRTVADWTIRPRLLAVPGVAKVAIFGGEVRQLQVQVRADRLIAYGLSLDDVLAAARKATGVRGAGFLDTPNQRIVVQTEAQSLTTADFARTALVHQGGATITLGDVANVVDAPEPPIGAATVNGKTGVTIVVSQQYGSDTVEVTRSVEAALNELRSSLDRQSILLTPDLFRPANFIRTATDNIRGALEIGGALVVLVLFLFLFDLRIAAISAIAIPMSLLTAIIVLRQLGVSLNTMTLGGLAIAIGEVVDDAVIGVENIVRRLRENRRVGQPRPTWRVIFDASMEVRGAVVYATFAIVLVFVPLLTLSGVAGRLFAPLGIAYVSATLASLGVALTLTPALSALLLAGRSNPDDPPVVTWLHARYRGLVVAVVRRPQPVFAGALIATGLAVIALPFFGATFLPELKEGHFIIHMAAVPGTSIEESLRIGDEITKALRQMPFVRSVSQQVGRAERADDTWGTHYSETQVDLVPLDGNEAEAAEAKIRSVLGWFPGVSSQMETFLTERIEETLTGFQSAVVVNCYGGDLDALDRFAQNIAGALRGVNGAIDIQIQSPPGMPALVIRLRKPDLERWGFQATDVLDAVRVAYQGDVVGQVYDGNRVFGVAVTLDPAERREPMTIGALPLRNADGVYVPLSSLADIYQTQGRYQVLHQGARRIQAVTANVAGRDVASFVNEARAAVGMLSLPAGAYVEFAGMAEAQSQSQRDLLFNAAGAGLGIVLLLSIATRHWRNLVLVIVNLPFAFVGGVIAVFATGALLSLGSLVGFVTLFGITLRNSIMLISHYEHLVEAEGMVWDEDAAVRGAVERVAPILMTSLVTALGLLPLAIGMEEPGREIEGPMAVVILGGLFTSMVLNLIVLPPLALRFGRFALRTDEFGQNA